VCLDNIYNQLVDKNISNQIEIIVSDNNSDDDTEIVVKDYIKNNDNIFYYKNEKNLGFDANVDASITKATGIFRWILADDDYIIDGAISFIMQIIKNNNNIAFIGVCDSTQSVNGDYEYFSNGSECLTKMGIFSGGVSRCIFNKNYLPLDRGNYYKINYYGIGWIHLYMAIEIVAKRKMMMVKNIFKVQEPVVARWSENGAAFYSSTNIRKIFKDSLKIGYDKTIVNNIISGLTKIMPRNLVSAKLRGLPISWINFKILFSEFYDYPIYLIILLLIFLCPIFILKITKKLILSTDNGVL